MVRGPTLLGTAISGLPVVFVRAMLRSPLIMFTVKVCCRLSPAAPVPVREVIAGGTIGVPGVDRRRRVCRRVDPVARSREASKERQDRGCVV